MNKNPQVESADGVNFYRLDKVYGGKVVNASDDEGNITTQPETDDIVTNISSASDANGTAVNLTKDLIPADFVLDSDGNRIVRAVYQSQDATKAVDFTLVEIDGETGEEIGRVTKTITPDVDFGYTPDRKTIDGKITFDVKDEAYAESGTYTFYAKEIGRNGTDQPGDITFDDKYYKVTVQIVKTSTTAVVGSTSVTTHNSLVVENSITYGNENKGEGKVFTNKMNPSSGEELATTPWKLEFTKSFKSLNDQNLFEIDADKLASMGIDSTFAFELYGAKTETMDGAERIVPDTENLLASTTNDGSGNVTLQFVDEGTVEKGNTDDEGSFLAKTGDFLKIAGIVALAVIGLLVLVMATRRARKDKDVVTRR